MTSIKINSKEDVLRLFESRKVSHVHVGHTDLTGQLRGKYISRAKFLSALEGGIAMTRNLAAVDFTDVIYPVEGLIVNGGGYGDSVARIVPESCREVPWEAPDRNLFFLIEHTGEGVEYDARALCQGVMNRATAMGFRPYLSCEFEFRLFNETPKTLQEKSYRNLDLVTPVSNYLGVMRQTAWSDFFADLTREIEYLGIPIETAHWELGAGFGELVLEYQEGMRAADNAVIYKTFAKAFALRREMILSFMARFSASGDGSSCHIHSSLRDLDGNPVFHDSSKPNNMSDTMRHFIGGMQKCTPELMLMLAPNVNSFKRYLPGLFAPVASTWGIDNRTTSLRAIVGPPKSQRVENRVPGADVNPYLAIACTLGSGLWGIENQIEPDQDIEGDLYTEMDSIPKERMFPETFSDAVRRFRDSPIAKELFGAEFVRVFAAGKAEHELEFRKAITDWEVRRFLELT